MCVCWFFILSQEKEKQKNSYKAEIDSQMEKRNIMLSIEILLTDPRVTKQNKCGNKRFVEGKTIKRQDMSTIKVLRATTFTTIVGCSDLEFLMK
jgi:hypothetical protein